MLTSLTEYAKMHGKSGDTVRRIAMSGIKNYLRGTATTFTIIISMPFIAEHLPG